MSRSTEPRSHLNLDGPPSRTVGLVLARGGSRGLPGKNLRELDGVPLVGRAVSTLVESPGVGRVFVSTDDAQIAAVARDFGAAIIDRPPELATDSATAADAIEHAVRLLTDRGESADAVVMLQATTPFTTARDVEGAIETFDRVRADRLLSVTPVAEHPQWMVTVEDDRLEFLVDATRRAARRQDLPPVYKLNGAIYIYRWSRILDGTIADTDAAAYIMPREQSIDIDTEDDWRRAEAQLRSSVEE